MGAVAVTAGVSGLKRVTVQLSSPTDVAGWRAAARRLRLAEVAPEAVTWRVGEGEAALFDDAALPDAPAGAGFTAPRELLALASDALLNRAEDRWALMYRILWRLKDEPDLLKILTDPDVDQAQGYLKAVRQAEHKMHAFLRFRRVDKPINKTKFDHRTVVYDPKTEEYIAWFEPPHYVLEKACPFFVRRLANVPFGILTPYASAWWDTKVMRYGAGGDGSEIPDKDGVEDDWKVYFTHVFNPARLNPKVMVQHMARHYWRNLPEAELIPGMIETAAARAAAMIAAQPAPPSERALKIAARRERDAPIDSGIAPAVLSEVAAGVQVCRRCDLWRDATQGVPGEGPLAAALMFVGEQPGDMEDLRGRPFVGPAGELFNRALAEAGIARDTTYVTNAVKHFKHEPRGKRRIHKTPAAGEVKACRWWLENELRLVRPKVVVALGSTAAGSVFGRAVAVMKERGKPQRLDGGGAAIATVHPSYLLRLPDEDARRQGFADFVADLKAAKALAGA
jgi:DNA polymerase